MKAALLLCLLAAPALAETPLTVDQFEARVTGKIMAHSVGDAVPQAFEEYLPGRRSRWVTTNGTCMNGVYYQQGPLICFQYEDGGAPDCWTYLDTPQGMTARLETPEPDPLTYTLRESPKMLGCPGPDVGT